MKFIKVRNVRGFNHSHDTKYTVFDLNRSNDQYNYEAGTDRMPRKDSKYWSHRFLVWDVERNFRITAPKDLDVLK